MSDGDLYAKTRNVLGATWNDAISAVQVVKTKVLRENGLKVIFPSCLAVVVRTLKFDLNTRNLSGNVYDNISVYDSDLP